MRKAFECVLCEGIYADAPVSECDCASKANVFSEGVILSGAEWESLRKDAERYRWLRDGADYCDTRDIPGMAPARMDAFIDAALSRGEQS